MAYTFLQLRGRVNDVPHLPKNQSQAEVDALINESYAYVVAELRLLQKSVIKTLTAALGDYTFVSSFALPDYASLRALFYTAANGLTNFQPLTPLSTAELMSLRQGNPSATSPALAYSMNGWNSLSLQPLPATGDTLTIFYSAYPVALVSPADIPVAIPTHLQHLIVGHCAAVAMETVDINVANRMHADFEQNEMGRARRWINNHYGSMPYGPGAYQRPNLYPGDYFSRRW